MKIVDNKKSEQLCFLENGTAFRHADHKYELFLKISNRTETIDLLGLDDEDGYILVYNLTKNRIEQIEDEDYVTIVPAELHIN